MDTRNLIKVVQCAVDGPRTDAASVGDGLGGMAGGMGILIVTPISHFL